MPRLRLLRRRRRDRRAALALVVLLGVLGVSMWWASRKPPGLDRIVRLWSGAYGVDESLVLAVIRAESGFDPDARSGKNAIGLMQVRPATGAEIAGKLGIRGFKDEDLYDPETNVRIGTFYLAEMLRRFPDRRLALAAYNAGPGRVQGWMKEQPGADAETVLRRAAYRETREYVARVLRHAN
jgi:soluble lytic murein transglycosylase